MSRLNVNLPQTTADLMVTLKELGGFKTDRELVDNAFVFFAWALNESMQGKQIASVNEAKGSYRQIVTPQLENAAIIGKKMR